MKNIGITFIAFTSLILSACHESAPGKVTNELSAAFLTSCSSNADCAEGLKCENGKCISSVIQDIVVPPGGCKTEGDCSNGKNCVNGICVEKIKVECVADADCGENQNCVDGVCGVRDKPECVDNSGCKSGEICQEGKCLAFKLPDGVDAGTVAGAAVGGSVNVQIDGGGGLPAGGLPAEGDSGEVAPGGGENGKEGGTKDTKKCGQGYVSINEVCIWMGAGLSPRQKEGVTLTGECTPACGTGFTCLNGTCTMISGLGGGLPGGKIVVLKEPGACVVQQDCDTYSLGTVCISGQCLAKVVNEPTNTCEIDGVKGTIDAEGKCSVKQAPPSPIVQRIGLKIKTADYNGAGTDAIFALKFCKNKTCEDNASKVYFIGKTDGSDFKDSYEIYGTAMPPSCDGFAPCSKASLEKGSLDDFFVKISDGSKTSYVSSNELFTLEDLKKLDHYQIDLVKEIGKTPEWNIEAIEISATTKNGVNILYSSPIVYDGYVHSYKSAKFSLKSDLVVVLDVTTASIDNAGTEDDVYFNFKFPEIDGTGKKINVSSWKNYLVEGKKKKIVVTYSDFPKNLTVAPKFQFFNAGGDGWAVEEFKVYIFNPADNSGVISDFCWGDNCSAAASDKQLWSYHFEGYSAPLGNNGQIAPNGCFNADGVLWLDTDTQGCSSTSWIQAEQGMPYLGFDDVK